METLTSHKHAVVFGGDEAAGGVGRLQSSDVCTPVTGNDGRRRYRPSLCLWRSSFNAPRIFT